MYNILIVDDEELEKHVLGKIIKDYFKEKCTLLFAANGREAQEEAEYKKLDLVIMDIEMPGINGIQVTEKIKNLQPDCSLIFITAHDEFRYAREAIHLGAKDYILKPYMAKEVITAIERVLEHIQVQNRYLQKSFLEQVGEPLNEHERSQKLSFVVQEMMDYLNANYYKDISLQDAAEALHYSRSYFSKLFKQCFNKNFTAYLIEIRMEAAKQLLSKSLVNIKEISNKVGYSDSNYFTKVFKRSTGMNPSEYREKMYNKS